LGKTEAAVLEVVALMEHITSIDGMPHANIVLLIFRP